MKSAFTALLALSILAAPTFAQSAAALKRELRTKESEAKQDKTVESLFAVAQWASEKGLAADAKRLFLAVLKQDPEHEGANIGLGNALFEGKWMPKKKADELREKAMDAEFKAKGFTKVDGVWVDPEHVADAKRGVFHHGNDLVTKDEKLALMAGMVRHPNTGLLIDAADAEKAAQNQYPIGNEKRWVDEKIADIYHSDLSHPWVVRSAHGTLMATLPMSRTGELKIHVDRGCERVAPLLGGKPPLPPNRPIVLVAVTEDEYRQLGNQFGDETSAAPAFLMSEEATITLPYHGASRAGICDASNQGLAPYYTRHAAALAYLQGKCADAGAVVPKWFQHGVGALASRFENDFDGAHFCRTAIVPKGGAKNLKGFLSGWTLNGEMESLQISYNVALVGLLIHFATQGGHKKVTDAMVAITESFDKADKAGIEKGVEKLAAALIDAEDAVAAHMQKLLDANR